MSNVKRILVTGGAGFIGSNLCERLWKEGNYIICLDNLFTGRLDNIKHLINKERFEFIKQDIIEPINLKVNEIYNLACPASPVHYQYDPIKTAKTSVLGIINMLELARRNNARILHSSTSEVYGDPLVHPQNEQYWGNVNPIGIRSCYDEGKRLAETLMMDYYRKYNTNIAIIRIFNTYGRNMRQDDGRVISNFICQALKGEDLTIYGDGNQTRSFCFIDDLIEGMIRMMKSSIIGPLNLGNPEEYNMLQLADKIINMINSGSRVIFKPLPQDDPIKRKPDITKAIDLIGWRPSIKLEEGLSKTIEYFKKSILDENINKNNHTIAVIGTGYVGLVSGVCFAEKGNSVICVDIDNEKINKLNNGIMPIYEEGLEEICNRNRSQGRLEFTTDLSCAIKRSRIIMIAVGTPQLLNGQADMSHIKNVATNIAKYINDYKIIINKSTVPVGTQKWITNLIKENLNENHDFDVVSNPEFLKEGTAIFDTFHGDRIVIGSNSTRALKVMLELYSNFNQPIFTTNPESAEIIKYASNAFLATKISYINEIANICEKVGADIEDVSKGIGMDRRISPEFLKAGIGFGGACFPKDTKALIKIGEEFGYELQIVNSAVKVNENQKMRPIEKLLSALVDVKGKTIGILGLAFKPGTDDIREAPSITIILELQKLGCNIKAYDPIAMDSFKKVLNNLYFTNSAYDAVKGTDAVILITEWAEFRRLDMSEIKKLMKGNTFIDGRNLYNLDDMIGLGFDYYCIGKKDTSYYKEEINRLEEVAASRI